jgi:hypothetical protein
MCQHRRRGVRWRKRPLDAVGTKGEAFIRTASRIRRLKTVQNAEANLSDEDLAVTSYQSGFGMVGPRREWGAVLVSASTRGGFTAEILHHSSRLVACAAVPDAVAQDSRRVS